MTVQRKALVLGGNSSLLTYFIEDLHKLGYEIHATSTQYSAAVGLVAKSIELDVRSEDSIDAFLKEASLESYDLIVNGIGKTSGIPLEHDSVHHVEEILRVNLTANIWLLPKLVDLLSNQGMLAYISSSSAEGKSFDIAYSASKAGLEAAISSYFNTRKLNNKRIYVIQPSLVDQSTMFYEMAAATIEAHRSKWSGKLLTKEDVSSALKDLIKAPTQENVIQHLRPIGHK